jgi:uncharacterized membrane protein
MTGKSPALSDDALAREVDKLLRKLPGADPYLRGDPDPAAPPKTTTSSTGSRPVSPVAPRRPAGPSRVQRIAVWVRVCLGALLGAVITQWPYQSACGVGLGFYLGAITAVLVAGVWAGVWSWRYRMGMAHGTSLGIVYWGAVLIANQILQRAGYAMVSATWSCGASR